MAQKGNGASAQKKLPLLKRLERQIDQSLGYKFDTPADLRRARFHFNWIDHAAFRKLWPNVAPVTQGVWRSSHPTAESLAWFQRQGVGTVLNLRGTHKRSHFHFEAEACDRLGLKLVNISLSARNLAKREVMLRLLDIFETIERPFVMHCKSGADRAGLASALYLIHMQGVPVRVARTHLSPVFLHFRYSSTGILDFMLDAFEKDSSDTAMTLRQWFETTYDAEKLIAAYRRSTGRATRGGARP